jgi:iron(III) transport system permease protein
MALPVALLVVRHPTQVAPSYSRARHSSILAMPGLVVALALGVLLRAARRTASRYQTGPTTDRRLRPHVLSTRARGSARLCKLRLPSPSRRSPGRSASHAPSESSWRVTLPLVAPGLGAAFCLVFLSCVTELTATLILIPDERADLSRRSSGPIRQNLSYGQAAPFALRHHRSSPPCARVPPRTLLRPAWCSFARSRLSRPVEPTPIAWST